MGAPEQILRIVAVGSVDDGKSTLLGRLLLDSGHLREDQVSEALRASSGRGLEKTALAFLTDGLKAERDQGITIDVAYRYFHRRNRKIILADVPGHAEYLANMVGGASRAEVAIVLLDARHGLVEQSKRHLFILSLFGVSHIVVAVNKMDLVGYSEARFDAVVADCEEYAAKLAIKDLVFIPVSALEGDNVVTRSAGMPWYEGTTVAYFLDHVSLSSEENLVDLRFPVQSVETAGGAGTPAGVFTAPGADTSGPGPAGRAFGRVASGLLRPGDELLALPSLKTARVASLSGGAPEAGGRLLTEAPAGRWVAVDFDSPVPLRRGDLLVRPHNLPHRADLLDATLLMLSRRASLSPGMPVLLQIGPERFPATLDEVRYRLEVEGLHRHPAEALTTNEIGRGIFSLDEPRWLDTVRRNRRRGSFLVLSPGSLDILAAGFIRDLRESHPEAAGQVVWLTGLPASGKSTIARATIDHLAELGYEAVHLDGDVFRGYVSGDLGFSAPDRRENIRRAAGVAALLCAAGHLVVVSFVSPSRSDRAAARNQVGPERFLEVHVETPVEVCRKRDPKGLYAKADRGEIAEFTGVGAPYEAPEAPEIRIETDDTGIAEAADRIVALLRLRGALNRPVRKRPGAADPSPGRPDPL